MLSNALPQIKTPGASRATPATTMAATYATALAQLTGRCATVMDLLTEGHSNKEIAARLKISMATVKAHISTILRTLDVDNRTQAALIGLRLRHGLDFATADETSQQK